MLNILAHLLYAIKIYDPDGHYDNAAFLQFLHRASKSAPLLFSR